MMKKTDKPIASSSDKGTSKVNYSAKYDVFLSYRRDGGEAMAILLRERLTQKGYRVFLDIENLNSGSFNKKLFDVIDNCRDFILICSKDCLDRCVNEDDWVRMEIARAFSKGKNIVPVMLRGFAFPNNLPEDIEKISLQNGVNANSHEYFDSAIDRLAEKFLTSEPHISIAEMSEKLETLINQEIPAARKKKKIKTAASIIFFCIILAVSVLLYSGIGVEKAEITIYNNTDDTLYSVYLKRSDAVDWGENIIGDNLLFSGETRIIKIPQKDMELNVTWDMQNIFYLGDVNRTVTVEKFSMFKLRDIIIYVDENGEYTREFIREN